MADTRDDKEDPRAAATDATHRPPAKKPDDGEPDPGEEPVEELAGLFGAGPKAPPPSTGPIRGEQYAP